MPKEKKKEKPGFSNEYGDEIKAAFLQIKPEELSKETVLVAAKQLVKAGFNPGAVIKILKAETGFGFSVRQVAAKKEEEAPAAVESGLTKKVTREIAREAAKKLETVLSTGKNLEDALGPFAQQFGYENTADFIVAMFDFWDVWHGQVPDLVKQRDEYAWAITQLINSMSPEVAESHIKDALQEFATNTMIAGQLSGNTPTPKEMMEHLQNLKEILRT